MPPGTIYDGRRPGPDRRPRSIRVRALNRRPGIPPIWGWVLVGSMAGGGCFCGGVFIAALYWLFNG